MLTTDAPTIAAPTMDWVKLVRAEYLEMPGLILTKAQIRRLWGIDSVTCDALIKALLGSGFLRCTSNDLYVRADSPV